jgi:thiosulfate dehydrogenase [quinone] large subunit
MTTTTRAGHAAVSGTDTPVVSGAARKALATLRIAFGLTFLWAFFDKLLALGFATGRSVDPATGNEVLDRFGDAAWINGGSPTYGFLNFGADGPFEDFYHSIAGDAWADWLFMLGLLGIGIGLTFGIAMRLSTISGAVMYVLMWTVVLPPPNNPVLDDHILGAISMVVLLLTAAGTTWGLGRQWNDIPLVQSQHWLR